MLRSTDEQHEDHEAWAGSEDIILGAPYVEDAAISASRYGRRARSGFADLAADLASGQFAADILALWEPGRGSRQVGEWVSLLDACETRKILIRVHTHGRVYDPARPRDRRTLLEDAVDSEFAAAKISESVRRALAANVRSGLPHGRIPYGYRRDYEVVRGKRVIIGQFPDPVTGPVVRRIFTDISAGRSLRSIAAALNAEGVPTPQGKPWKPTAVRRIAINPVYAGLRSHHGQISQGGWEPIVSVEEFYAVRELMTDPRRRRSRPGRAAHQLSHIAICDVCEGPMQIRLHKPAGPEYWCHRANHTWVPEADLDEYVSDLLKARLGRPDLYPQLGTADEAEIQAARDELAAATAHHRSMIALMKARRMSPLAFAEAEPAALEAVDAADRRLRALQLPPAVAAFLGTPHDSIEAAYDDAEISVQRDLIRAFFEEIRVGRLPGWQPGKVTQLTLAAEAPDGTMVRCEGSKPYKWAGLARRDDGGWVVAGRGMSPELGTARRYARARGEPADWVVVPFVVDSLVPDRVSFRWRGSGAA